MDVSQSITLGDALKRLSNNVQTELQNTLFLMRGQDPELRTTELRAFLSRTRAKLSQMYAMLRWLSSPGISQCFRSISDFNGQLLTMEGEMARNLDEMYFCHASIFSMRSRPLEIVKAKDILARETYHNLPAAMFSCGKPDFPTDLEPESVCRDLTVYIRTKLSLEDISDLRFPLTHTIQDGLLTIECSHYFRLFLTLKTLHEGSPWCVLNCLLLNDPATNAPTVSTFDSDKIAIEKTLVVTLRGIASAASSLVTDEGAAMESKEPEPVRNVLKELVAECRHVAVAAGVRLLHQQLITAPQCVAYFREAAQAALTEETVTSRSSSGVSSSVSGTYLSLKLWKSAFHGEAQFEVRVKPQPNSTTSIATNDEELSVNLHTTLTYRSPTLVFADDKRSFAIPGTGARLTGATYIAAGCDAAQLVRDALALLAAEKLAVLEMRLKYTMGRIGENAVAAVSVTRDSSGLTLRHAQCALSALHIRLDARDGKYLVDSTDLRDVADAERKVLELFSAEINNLDSENFISNYLLKHGASTASGESGTALTPFAHIVLDTPLITTLDDVVGLFDLCLWSEKLHATCPAAQGQHALVGKLLPALGLHRSRGLVYTLQCWDDLSSITNGALSTEYTSLFPASHLTLSRESLSSNLAPQTANAKRNVAKKRGFSEAALASTIPGDFVSASSLQAEIIAEQKVSFAAIKQTREVLALYVIIGIDQARHATAVSAVCRCRVSVSNGVVDPTSAVPVVLQRRSSDTRSGEFSLSDFVEESRVWAQTFVRAPATPSSFGFATNIGDASSPVKVDLLSHTDGGLSALFVDAADRSLQIVGVGYGVELSATSRSTWKGVINSLTGHFNEPVDLTNLAALTHNGATLSDMALSLLQGAEGSDSVEIVCTRAVLRFSQAFQDPPAYVATNVFATQFAQSLFRQWTLPVPVNGGLKTEILKRVKFVRDVWWLLQTLTAPTHEKQSSTHEDEMEVDDEEQNTSSVSSEYLLPLHFTVEAKPSTSSTSGCSAQLALALHTRQSTQDSAESVKNTPFVSRGAYLLVSFSYQTSTMRGMGKSISTAETSEVVFSDVVAEKFSRSHSLRELGEDNGALLKAVLVDYLQVHR